MHIVFVNSILQSPLDRRIRKVSTIKDSLPYNFCLAFKKLGHRVTLIAASDYAPRAKESYDIETIFFGSHFKRLFNPAYLPFHPGLFYYLLTHKHEIDLVISSEVLSLNSLMCAILVPGKLIVWHELKKHTKMLFRIPSRFWYAVIVPVFFRKIVIVPRSMRAKHFIERYLGSVTEEIIPSGVDLDRFGISETQDDFFIVIANLSKLKNISSIIGKFSAFANNHPSFNLLIAGDGPERESLRVFVSQLAMEARVTFLGFLSHDKLIGILARSKGLLIDTLMDNSMMSISEAISCGVPILSNCIPDNTEMVEKYGLGIVKQDWNESDLEELASRNDFFKDRCIGFRNTIGFDHLAKMMIEIRNEFLQGAR
jgi:1,2-diacylglycerol 3-alpha-glucosyltransferase